MRDYDCMRKAQPPKMDRYAPPDVRLSKKLGGGLLKELVVRELPSKKVVNYALAYINPAIYAGDNVRVLGYDNRHGFSHRHYFGVRTAEPFDSYEALYERFQREWLEIAKEYVNREKR